MSICVRPCPCVCARARVFCLVLIEYTVYQVSAFSLLLVMLLTGADVVVVVLSE